MGSIIGWDIGGAHLKAARVENGRVVDVVQLPCPLWLGLDRLTGAIDTALLQLGRADRHVATMTGELADIFPDRSSGVATITDALVRAVGDGALLLYGGRAGMLRPASARDHAGDIASANWHASAALAGRFEPEALFVDMGSTTTDLIPIFGGLICAAGYSDAERMASGELVYTGLTRTPLMALATRAPLAGAWVNVAAELFATAADVYRILSELPEEADQMQTADGREKTVAASRARLARMVGCDVSDAAEDAWRDLAFWFAEAQLRHVTDGAMLALSRTSLSLSAPLIVAGAGERLAIRLAERLGRPHRRFADIIGRAAGGAEFTGQCAPAVAVALLLDQEDAAA